ncbi:S-layer homology domain-containing protein [Intestinimonas timonensis]|uniref:S-layer homology domain-containing protein n=1 Tax=Intestinimonas timonensis TaxID=1689270 RepID=UPI00102F6BD1|nr:S-layer homology domain-containing protein [Intestinimonas timonensis]
MKKRIGSLLLILALCFTLLPSAAFAEENEQSSKISITTVDELLQFAKAVDNGEYDDKTDAVVSLDADLDLTGVTWTPIGSKFDTDGNLLHYFSGKFYGNGHTISNLDFSANYGKTEYPSFGFFSEVYGAEISGLTIQGNLDVSNAGYVYFGTVAGVAADSKIFDCVSDVSFTDTERADINGTVAMCGYAINSTIEYCQNKGDFSVMKDTSQFWMGGIAGLAENSTVQYCANTGDMTSWTPSSGGIVGQLIQNSKVINCYSTGKMAPLGKGTTDFGGIAGAVGKGTEIRHCYFAGEVDLSQYTATKPYTRLGGIAGGVSSDTPVFENNYFVETENVPACSKYTEAGTAKSLKYMETEDFFNEITAAGGNYRFNSNGTPLLPAPKYTVSFVVTPAELTNVVIKVNGQEVASPVGLEAGTYAVEVSADNCEVFNSNITITADTATHTQTITMTYRSSGGDDSDPTYAIEVGEDIRNGTVTANRRYAERGDTVTITVKPDDGFKLDDLTVTDKNGNELKLTDKGNGKYTFKMPAGKVTVSATFAPEKTAADYFADVPANSYYADAVLWAAKNGITGGIGNGLFGPNQPCTRAQIVTFLWRAAGSPEPKTMSSFADVSMDAYYAKAVAWAVENGITTGTGDGKFSPDATCTRAQSVTFLFRAIGKLVDSKAEFSDVLTDSYYANAVAWAVENGVTNGIGDGLFGPNNSCTRAQIVTFLFRAYQGK